MRVRLGKITGVKVKIKKKLKTKIVNNIPALCCRAGEDLEPHGELAEGQTCDVCKFRKK